MDAQDNKLIAQARNWVRENKKKLIAEFCDEEKFPKTNNPVTIFMAGTPGAGKTELSLKLAEEFGGNFVRIDADELREKMREIGYNGKNSPLFQTAAVKAVNILFDYSNKKGGQNVILDGTFAYGNWRENVERSLTNNRKVDIYYLYQDPIVAWDFVCRRSRNNNGRIVPLDVFISSYETAIKNVISAKQIFQDKITVHFVKNDYKRDIEQVIVDIEQIEEYLPKMYNIEELRKILHEREIE